MAVQRFGKNPRCRSLPASPGAGEKESMGNAIALKGIEQRAGDVFLSYEFMEILRAPFAGKYLILHRVKGRASGNLLHI